MIRIVNNHGWYYYDFDKFPDGTALIQPPIGMPYDSDFEIEWFYENDGEMVQLFYIVNHLRQQLRAKIIDLVMPYLPNARQDRVKDNKTDVFTLKYFCQFINSLYFDRVCVTDIHSTVGEALLDRCIHFFPKKEIETAIERSKAEVLFFPDEGAMKRYARHFSMPSISGIKTRNWATGKIDGLEIPEVGIATGRKVLIIDDICSYGGTFIRAAHELHDHDASEVSLYVTHCENSILKGDLLVSGLIKKVYTTNSIFTGTHEMIEVI